MPLVTVWPTPERVADGEDEVADLEPVGIGEAECRESLAGRIVDLQHCQVRFRIVEQQPDRIFAAARQRDADVVGAAHHMRIGDDDAGRVDD